MESLWRLVVFGVEDFNIAGGYITGQMEFKGPIGNPEFYGTGRATSMRFQVPNYLGGDIRIVPFEIIADGYDMTFGPVIASVGAGTGTAEGFFRFENWIPVIISLDINIPRPTPIPYDFNILGFLANGNASGNLGMTIDLFNYMLELTGNIYINESELGLNMEEIISYTETTGNDIMNTIIDFTITTGPMVEFAWPASGPIIRANPEIGTVIYVFSDSQNRQYSLNSDIRIRSGELFYFERSFYIRQGNIVFRENENQFDPRISARAEIRDRSDAGTVTISMIVENQPLLNFEPRFEASPNLSQLEIYSILGQNFNVSQSDNMDGVTRSLLTSTTELLTQIIASSDILSQFVFFRQFERSVRDYFNLDMFSIRTRLLHNAVISGVTGFALDPVDRNYGVGNYFDNTTVFIGKYLGKDMIVQGMLTTSHEENNGTFGSIVLEPDIGIELQTPFNVNIRWDFFPYHPKNWWVSGNSITLSWSKSY